MASLVCLLDLAVDYCEEFWNITRISINIPSQYQSRLKQKLMKSTWVVWAECWAERVGQKL